MPLSRKHMYWADDGDVQTTSHTLAYSFIFLALYQEEQEKFYQSIKTVLSDGRTPVSLSAHDFSALPHASPSRHTKTSKRSTTPWRKFAIASIHTRTPSASDRSHSVFNETLRLFPPVITIPKQATEDTSFTTTNSLGEKRTIPVPKGTYVTVHTPGLHNNRTSPRASLSRRRPPAAMPCLVVLV